ncbi:hypothetical protein GCM10017562_59960 [Streptomyces roseofulvus]|uniref:hypothetical protein n=1 Tax=Streptomyces roseofulvus TaxID=33902 RepID=UPI0031FCED4E
MADTALTAASMVATLASVPPLAVAAIARQRATVHGALGLACLLLLLSFVLDVLAA